jgi:hypothetical protein
VHVRSRKEEEEEMLIVWHWDKVMGLIHAGDLTNHMQSLQRTLPGKKVTLVIYGAEEHFRSELNQHGHTGMLLTQHLTYSLYYRQIFVRCVWTQPFCCVQSLHWLLLFLLSHL